MITYLSSFIYTVLFNPDQFVTEQAMKGGVHTNRTMTEESACRCVLHSDQKRCVLHSDQKRCACVGH